MKKYNFSAGPAILAQPVIDEIALGIKDFENSGLSILELSHRGPEYDRINAEAHDMVRELLNLPYNYHPFFLFGGATTLFSLIPMNILKEDETMAFVDTGVWSMKAIKSAGFYGKAQVVASSEDKSYNYVPEIPRDLSDASLLHLTSNNTIYGTRFQEYPNIEIPLIADFSSDIFSEPIDITQFGLIYASAQKNLGPSGTTLVVIREDLLRRSGRALPPIFDFKSHIEKESRLNTPPMFSIYGCWVNMKWIQKMGLANLAKSNEEKAIRLYAAIDKSSLFNCNVPKAEDRSKMNVTFQISKKDLEGAFLKYSASRGIVGIKGHRLSGGFRASIYNAMDLDGVDALIETIESFEKEKA